MSTPIEVIRSTPDMSKRGLKKETMPLLDLKQCNATKRDRVPTMKRSKKHAPTYH
jgi:hypothetical protein